MLAAMAVLVAPAASAAPGKGNNGNPDDNAKIQLCHWTNGDHYNYLDISINAVLQQGHLQHQNNQDIIPPFDYTGAGGAAQHFPGANWPEGEETLKNGCNIPAASLGLTKTADPAQFSDSGTVITYTFTVTNTGKATISNLSVVDGPFTGTGSFGSITCAAASLAPTAITTCTASYLTTNDDVANGKSGKDLRNSAYATGTSFGGNVTSPRATATVTYVPPAPVAIPVTLTKNWVQPGVGNTDAVDLSIDGVKSGESTADGKKSTPATATALQGSSVTLTEAYAPAGKESDYDTALTCTTNSGLTTTVSKGQLSGTYSIPKDALSVACAFSNTLTSSLGDASTVNLTKIWNGPADAGNEVGLVVTDATTKTSDASGTSTAGGAGTASSLQVFPGDSVTISENAMGTTDLSHYNAEYACTVGGDAIDLVGSATFKVPDTLAANSTINCTITNTHKTMVTVDKQWIIGNDTYTLPWDGVSPTVPADYHATLTVDNAAQNWGYAFPIDPSAPLPAIGEVDSSTPDPGCTVNATFPDLNTLTPGTDNTVVVTNTVTCTEPGNPGDGTPGGGNPGGVVPPTSTPPALVAPQVQGVSNSVTPPPAPPKSIEVKGVSRQETAPHVEVLGTSQSLAAAPSANAHTGQGTSPWVYALLAAGLTLMLGAAGLRRRGQA